MWLSTFEILQDDFSSKEIINFFWNKITLILQAGFQEMNYQVQEIFFPAFSLFRKNESLEDIS
jgi:hypothetical protein